MRPWLDGLIERAIDQRRDQPQRPVRPGAYRRHIQRGCRAGVSPEAALEKHTRDPALMGALERGGSHLIVMPRLVCMTVVDDARLRFSEAVYPKIGLMNGSRVRLWLRDMETAFEPIASWLP